MPITTPSVEDYLDRLTKPSDEVLARMQEHAERDQIPIVVPTTGSFLEVITSATAVKKAVEVGTAIGVSTLHIARGGAHVTSFEVDQERFDAATEYLDQAKLSDRVDLRLQDASEGLKALTGPFDLAFVDGPKNLYGSHIEDITGLLRPGGLLLVDNALMSGEVADRSSDKWELDQINAMRDLHASLINDDRFRTTVLAVGDGLIMSVLTPQ